jgi:arylsulfatase A-like enzyme/Flp pilus assembly protein TadD
LLARVVTRRYGAPGSGYVLILHLLLACSGAPPGPPVVEGPPPDVVVVTMDTTRADRIGAYGYAQAKTDTIDRLAAEGLRFDNARSPLPLTIPAHATMFTGLFPYHHHIRGNGDNVLGPEFTTLAEVLRRGGWATAASVGAFVTTRQWGFSQGFDAYFDTLPEGDEHDRNFWHSERPGDQVVDDALNWLAGVPPEQPVFLWVHLYDAHFPYVPRGEYAETFKDRPYDGELAFVDDQIGRLVDAFSGRKVLWSLLADHGESLGEHHEPTHGLFNYEGTQHVPWIISGAGIPVGVVKEAVSTADLMPTLLRMLNLPIPDGLDGRPQPGSPTVPYSEAYGLADRFRLAPHRTVVEGNLKLIATPRPELYDVATDPAEANNLADQRPDDVARMQASLAALNATPPEKGAANLDAETVSQLASLGYVSGGGDEGIDPLSLPDPKDYTTFLDGVAALEHHTAGETAEESLAKLDTVIALKPDTFELRMRRLPLLAQLGRMDEAKDFLAETSAMFPDRGRVWTTLAGLSMKEQDYTQALAYAKKGVEVDPLDPGVREALVEALFHLKRPDEALAEADAALKVDAKNYGVAALLGQHYLTAQDYANAEKYLRLAIAGPNPRRAARAQLALLAVAAGARGDAYTLLEAEVKDYPGNRTARRMLSRLYAEDERWLDQREQVAFLARAAPNDPVALRALAQCLFNLADYPAARVSLDAALAIAPEDPDVLLLHANLLAKEGKRDEGMEVFKHATVLNEARVKEIEAANAKAAAAEKAHPGKGRTAPGSGTAPKGGAKGGAKGAAPAPGAAAPAGGK